MKISVVVPAFNEEKLLPATLCGFRAAAAAFDDLGWAWEIIVCDNNSTDRTAEVARTGGATVVFEPVNQIGQARNTGAASASGDWLIFVDADSQPPPELFADVVLEIQSGKCIAGGSTIKLDANHFGYNLLVGMWNKLSRWRHLLAGSFIFCEAQSFRKVGGFNPELFAAEEIDLSIKLKKLAQQTGRSLVILHRHPLVTSARKAHLYSTREHFSFFAKSALQRGGTLKKRDDCPIWYDGRR